MWGEGGPGSGIKDNNNHVSLFHVELYNFPEFLWLSYKQVIVQRLIEQVTVMDKYIINSPL